LNIYTLKIPPQLELQASLNFAQEALTVPSETTILSLDFSAWGQAKAHELPLKPFGMLIISQAVRQLRKRLPNVVIVPTLPAKNDIEGYAAHMGFFDACGIELKKPFGDAKGSHTYLPITQVMTDNLFISSQAEDLGKELARKLTQQNDGKLVKTLEFSFMEIIRNVIEHSRSKDFWYCAQYWSSKGEAEIALIDCGMGLRQSLLDNPHLRPTLTDDRIALKYALMPGISGKMYAGKVSNPDDIWENTGFGLYMNYRICNEGGNFFIASGDSGLYREVGEDNHYTSYSLPGVALRLRMRSNTLEQYDSHYHHIFMQEGLAEAQRLSGGVIPTAERMSTMLRSGFSEPSKKDHS
jgi:hypothetical protein